MSGTRSGLLGCLVLAMGATAIACSAPVSTSTPLIVCEAGEKGCPSDEPKAPKQSTKKSSDDEDDKEPSDSPVPASTQDEEPPAASDAGPDPKPAPGPICTRLKACCDQLKAAGYSDATCLEIVDTASENACSLQHKQYKDFGDCT